MAITVQRNGLTFAVRPFSTDLFVFGQVAEYWPLLNLQPSDRVLDIGGHLGAFALPAATICQSVDVYEPDDESSTLLAWNIAANGLRNVRAHPEAITGSYASAVPFYICTGPSTTRHSLVPLPGCTAVTVRAMNISTALQQSGASVVKMDAEGSELDVLRGVGDWSQVDRMVFEYHRDKLGDITLSLFVAVLGFLRSIFAFVATQNPRNRNAWLVYCGRRPAPLPSGWLMVPACQ